MKSKFIFAILFLLLVVWLAVSPKTTNRQSEINAALDKGLIGNLSRSEKDHLDSIINSIGQELKIKEGICLNCPFDSIKKLRFFTCDVTQYELTKCAEGNAVFDSKLNAVFVDNSIALPKKWMGYGTFGNQPNLPFLEIYLQFVLLHELGHYSLHKDIGGFFDSFNSDRGRKYELEADAFAFSHYVSLIEHDMTGLFFNKEMVENARFEFDPKLPVTDRPFITLALMSRNINLGMLFGVSKYSEFYHDDAHPDYISRSRTILDKITSANSSVNMYSAKAKLNKAFLTQLERIVSKHAMVEVSCSRQILNLVFDDTGILVQSLDSLLLHADYDKITPNGKPPSIQQATAEERISDKSFFDLDRTFSFADGSVYSSNTESIFSLQGNHWKTPKETNLRKLSDISYIPVQIQPSSRAVYLQKDSLCYTIDSHKNLHTISIKNILAAARKSTENPKAYLRLGDVLIVSERAFFPITAFKDSGDQFLGILSLDLTTRKYTVLKFNLDNPKLAVVSNHYDNYKTSILCAKNCKDFYLLSSQGSDDKKMVLWRLFPNQKPIKILEHTFEYASIPGVKGLEIEPMLYPRTITSISQGRFLINWDDDLIYLLDPGHKTIEPIFHFGASTLRVRASANGLVAIYSPLAYKFFIMKL